MNSLMFPAWVPILCVWVGVGAGWLWQRALAKSDMRHLMDRLVLRDNELRSARAALVRERQVRLNAQASLQKLERLQSDRDRDLDEYLIEIDDDTPDSITFESFFLSVDGVPSEPPPRQSDVRELRQRPSAAAITQRAYELWEEAGKPAGQDDHFWFLAEAELQAQDEWRSALGF